MFTKAGGQSCSAAKGRLLESVAKWLVLLVGQLLVLIARERWRCLMANRKVGVVGGQGARGPQRLCTKAEALHQAASWLRGEGQARVQESRRRLTSVIAVWRLDVPCPAPVSPLQS